MSTLLLKNVKILGGGGKGERASCIFVSGDKISAIGDFPNKDADEVIDGQGSFLSPGFIDVDNDSDHYLGIFENPPQEDFSKQGITTIIGGQCGSSLAPLLYGTLESIRKWAVDVDKINVNWHGLKEFLDVLEKQRIGVNFGTLIGHSTIRRALSGDKPRALTRNEINVFGEALKRALAEGGFGMSTGLGYMHGRPASYQEIKFLAQLVKKSGGVYATHLREGGKRLGEAVDETIKLAEETKIKTLISHFLPHYGEEKEYKEALQKLEELPPETDFYFDIYPFDTSVLPIYTFLPLWAQRENWEKMRKDLEDEWLRNKIIKDMPEINPDDLIVAEAAKNTHLIGKSLSEAMEIYSLKDAKEALLKLMSVTGFRAVVFYKNINKDLLSDAIKHPRSLIATNSASLGEHSEALKPERAVSTFTKFLKLVETENILPLEEAIKKITFVPARKFGLKGRGELKEGNFADLVVFRDGEIKFTVINGKMAVKNGESTDVLSGKILRRQ